MIEYETKGSLEPFEKSRLLRYLGLSVAAVVLVIIILLLGGKFSPLVSNGTSLPSDATLEKVFRQHEVEFNRLISMSDDDAKVIRIAQDFTWLEDNSKWPRPESELGFTKQRWDEYRQLFKELGLKEGLARNTDGSTVELIAFSQGLSTGGSGKGYVYSTKELFPLYNSLDELSSTASGGKYVYKRLKGNWYLFYYSR